MKRFWGAESIDRGASSWLRAKVKHSPLRSVVLAQPYASKIGRLMEEVETRIRSESWKPFHNGARNYAHVSLSTCGDFVFKLHDLRRKSFIERFASRYRLPDRRYGYRHGWAEWVNMGKARELGVLTPKPVFYLQFSDPRLSDIQIVASRFVKRCVPLKIAFATLDREHAYRLCETVVHDLSQKGVFHCDLNAENILIPEGGGNLFVIDWVYACFSRKDFPALYGFYMGHIAKRIDADSANLVSDFFSKELGRRCVTEIEKVQARDSFFRAKEGLINRRERFQSFV